ncbi:PHP domain-containing protein [Clostridium botulinum]|uniref:PHP domain-containing protein n=1 Tax=Clostridium botulinum TaxID=1491 RepID=UPI001C9AF146|nr:PHP domain-containing protein [Clostridium botulinum]MBY6838669.1 PHP domain-containing protein [Clostridium botulinum]
MKNNYVAYHLHDDTSNCNGYADSCTKYDEYIKLAKKEGMNAIAFSNHGGIYDWIKKKQCCDNNNIKYIHGVELYCCINLEDNTRGYHIGLYSKNWNGVLELNTLMSKSTSKGILNDKSDRHRYFNPRISFEEIMNTSDNIIITTACLASPLNKLGDKSIIYNKDGDETLEGLEKYKYNISKRNELLKWMSNNRDRCFLEIQYHNCEEQIKYNKDILRWSKEYNIPLIAGTDTHSSTVYKAECRKVLQIAKDSFYGDEDSFDLTWKTYEELLDAFKKQNSIPMKYVLEAIENTNVFADMVENFTLDKTFKYPTLYGNNAKSLWKQRILKMLKEKKEKNIIDVKRYKEYKNAISEEFKVMSKLGMESFMLFMSELMEWCKSQDIHSSPCRGSVGGSVIAFITDIISVDPIVWKTVFSRFCNEDRISLGDIDEDFAPKDRIKVYNYIISRFGNKNVSYILSLGTIQDRGSIDVLAKGLNYKDLSLVKDIKNKFDDIFNEYSKIIQAEVNLEELAEEEDVSSKSPNFDDYNLYIKRINNDKKRKRLIELNDSWIKLREDNQKLFYYFDGIKGTYISKGNHPSGMIGSPVTLFDNLGVFYKDGDEGFPVSFCAMKAVDSLNYVKFDILGLKTIGILQDTYKLLGKQWEEDNEIDWNDDLVWDDIITNNTGIFQFEGEYAFDLLSQFKPHAINDMSLVNASLRPSGKSYRDRLIAREFNHNPSELIDGLLKQNNGFLVFQEDTIAFLQQICGMTGSEADTTRRAIGKKDEELLKKQLPKILEGYCNCSNKPRNLSEQEAKEFIQIVQDSSEYQFGYNHSTGYSMNGYKCGRLRYYYPLEFTTSYLNNAENQSDIDNGISLAKYKNIKILNPKFRYSKGKYMCDRDTNTVYKGIESIKYLNSECADQLYELRDNTYNKFLDLLSDMNNINTNSRQIQGLIYLDYFSEFGKTKKILDTYNLYQTLNGKKQIKKDKIKELNLSEDLLKKYSIKETDKTFKFDEDGMNNIIEEISNNFENKHVPLQDKLYMEIEYLGYLITQIKQGDFYYVTEIKEYNNKKSITRYLTMYDLKTLEKVKYKLSDFRLFAENPIKENQLIKIISSKKTPKKYKDENDKWQIKKGEFNLCMEEWLSYPMSKLIKE